MGLVALREFALKAGVERIYEQVWRHIHSVTFSVLGSLPFSGGLPAAADQVWFQRSSMSSAGLPVWQRSFPEAPRNNLRPGDAMAHADWRRTFFFEKW